MALFAVLMPVPNPGLVDAIKAAFPNDHLSLNETQWLISATGTVIEITARIGIYDPKQPQVATGSAVVVAVSAYFGRAPATVWDWMKAKLEASPNV
jgi:hypothetical protein